MVNLNEPWVLESIAFGFAYCVLSIGLIIYLLVTAIVYVVKKLLKCFVGIPCSHEFDWDDLERTNIPPLERPPDYATQAEWNRYYRNRDKHESVTKRVKWPCWKCGKTFYAHCGLNILEHGKAVRIKEKQRLKEGNDAE